MPPAGNKKSLADYVYRFMVSRLAWLFRMPYRHPLGLSAWSSWYPMFTRREFTISYFRLGRFYPSALYSPRTIFPRPKASRRQALLTCYCPL